MGEVATRGFIGWIEGSFGSWPNTVPATELELPVKALQGKSAATENSLVIT